ncbi:MAG TPA: hypothetical protein VH325_19210 [Bryobacteraceae bacterium]|jgi:hypothetical protein|nr:hypothetical protein [Bryobacteraceae bacterium]
MTGPGDSGGRGMISIKTAMILYAVLAVFAILTLKKEWLFVALVILGGAAIKTYISHVRRKLE